MSNKNPLSLVIHFAKRSLCNLGRQEKAATMIEMALLVPVFFLILLGFYDFSRYLLVQSMLIKGAQEGLNLAKVIHGADNDLRAISSPTTADQDEFLFAYQQIITAATRIPLNTIFAPSGQTNPGVPGNVRGTQQLQGWERALWPGDTTRVFDAVLLRPGEEAITRYHADIAAIRGVPNVVVANSFCGPGNVAACTLLASPGQQSYEQLLGMAPLEVQVRARFDFFLPLFEDTQVIGRAIGYREIPNRTANSQPGATVTVTTVSTTTLGTQPSPSPTPIPPSPSSTPSTPPSPPPTTVPSVTPSVTPQPSASASIPPTVAPSPAPSASGSPFLPTSTPSGSPIPVTTGSPAPAVSSSPPPSPIPSVSPQPTPSSTPQPSPTSSPKPTPTSSPKPTPSPSPIPTEPLPDGCSSSDCTAQEFVAYGCFGYGTPEDGVCPCLCPGR